MIRFLTIILFLLPLKGKAQTCCSGGVPVSSNLGFQSSDKGSLQLSLSADFNFLKTLKSGSHSLDDDDRLRTTQSYIFRTSYSITRKFSVEAILPYIRQTRRITTSTGAFDREATNGIGDPVLLGIYNVIDKDIVLRIGAGPQFPLGSSDEIGNRGLLLLEDLQPGSGAWDFIFFASTEYSLTARPSSLLYYNLIISQTGINKNSRGGAQSYKFGNDYQMILGYSDQLLIANQIISPGISLRYRRAARDEVDQLKLPGTGGRFAFARLSNSIPFPKLKSSLGVNIEIPLWSKVNDTQLAPTFGLNISWYYKLETQKPVYQSIIE